MKNYLKLSGFKLCNLICLIIFISNLVYSQQQEIIKSEGNPSFDQASLPTTQSSSGSNLNKTQLKRWASSKLPVECRFSPQFPNDMALMCAREYFSVNGEPINPKIIKEIHSWPDGRNPVISVNLFGSQDSHRYCCNDDINTRPSASRLYTFYVRDDNEEFGYRHIGRTTSGVNIIYTYYSGGGTGIFTSIYFFSIEQEKGISLDTEKLTIQTSNSRLILKNLGSIDLGDRWSGDISVDGDNLIIGKDQGRFAGTDSGGVFSKNPKNRTFKIPSPNEL